MKKNRRVKHLSLRIEEDNTVNIALHFFGEDRTKPMCSCSKREEFICQINFMLKGLSVDGKVFGQIVKELAAVEACFDLMDAMDVTLWKVTCMVFLFVTEDKEQVTACPLLVQVPFLSRGTQNFFVLKGDEFAVPNSWN